jgi:hypothetical protein
LAQWWIFELVFGAIGVGLVSVPFYFIVPFLIGYLCIALGLRQQPDLSASAIFFKPWLPILAFLGAALGLALGVALRRPALAWLGWRARCPVLLLANPLIWPVRLFVVAVAALLVAGVCKKATG